jgi:TonB family protein
VEITKPERDKPERPSQPDKPRRADRIASAKARPPKEEPPEEELPPPPPKVEEPPPPPPPPPKIDPPPPPKDTKPARTPVVAPSAVTKLSGEIPALKGTGTDSNGDVTVKICIDEQGRVTSTKVVRSTTDVPAELTSAIATWRYKPYVNKDGKPSPACVMHSMRLVFKR